MKVGRASLLRDKRMCWTSRCRFILIHFPNWLKSRTHLTSKNSQANLRQSKFSRQKCSLKRRRQNLPQHSHKRKLMHRCRAVKGRKFNLLIALLLRSLISQIGAQSHLSRRPLAKSQRWRHSKPRLSTERRKIVLTNLWSVVISSHRNPRTSIERHLLWGKRFRSL